MRLNAAARRGALAPALPVPYPALANAGLRIRNGQVSLTIGAPGAGKSQFWLNVAQRTGVPTLYHSADTDAHDVLLRVFALWSGHEATRIETSLTEPGGRRWYAEKAAAGRHVEWVFDSTITATGLAERMTAFAEVHGVYPELLVVDNLSNAVQSHSDELAEQKAFVRDCQELARDSRAHVAVLAHATGEYDDGRKAIPLSGTLNKLGKVPEVVLSLHRPDGSGRELAVCVTKNRGGSADPTAGHPIVLQVDFARSAIYGYEAA